MACLAQVSTASRRWKSWARIVATMDWMPAVPGTTSAVMIQRQDKSAAWAATKMAPTSCRSVGANGAATTASEGSHALALEFRRKGRTTATAPPPPQEQTGAPRKTLLSQAFTSLHAWFDAGGSSLGGAGGASVGAGGSHLWYPVRDVMHWTPNCTSSSASSASCSSKEMEAEDAMSSAPFSDQVSSSELAPVSVELPSSTKACFAWTACEEALQQLATSPAPARRSEGGKELARRGRASSQSSSSVTSLMNVFLTDT
mmetsp:Transcript_51959/g.111136  ORF Transcript_51959/g.111136 Transcript_51959/m.111136 type:complete len:258 (-) Transcript_51959:124-897(-)